MAQGRGTRAAAAWAVPSPLDNDGTTAPLGRPPRTLEEQIEAAVERAVIRALQPLITQVSRPEPAVYTVAQAAAVMQVSQDTVGRLVRRGVLPKLPHLNGKVLIPRVAVHDLVEGVLDDSRHPSRRA